MFQLPNITIGSPSRFEEAPLCEPCSEDEDRTVATYVINEVPMCTDHAHEEVGL